MRAEMGEWADLLDPMPDDWLAMQLAEALSKRTGLVLTGRNWAQGMQAPRFRLPQDVLAVSASSSEAKRSGDRVHLTLRPDAGRAEIAYSFHDPRPHQPEDFELAEVRIERAERADSRHPPPGPTAHFHPNPPVPKPRYTPEACRAWFLLRTRTWPADAPPSTADKCLAAARAHFAGEIPRDPFRALRRAVVPQSWRKHGPRISRK